MWPSFRLSVTAALIVVASTLVVALASTLALVRAQVERVDVDLASVIQADYSADPRGATLAPLDEEIVGVARQDVKRLQETLSGVEIVPVYHQPAPAATEPEALGTPSASRGQAPPASEPNDGETTPRPTQGASPGWATPGLSPTPPSATPPPGSPIATPLPTAAPTSSPTPAPSPITTLTPTQTRTPTPGPSPSPTGSPTRTPTSTPAPTAAPTASPTRTATASPTPTTTPFPVSGTLYLHNNPTPPLGDTAHQHELPMDGVLPGVPVLYNYDTDRDNAEGLLIVKGGSGPDEGDDAKHQHWVAPPFAGAVVIEGDAKVHLWSAMKDSGTGLDGVVTVYVRDCEGWDCVELGSDTVTKGGSSWMLLSFSVPIGTYTLAPGHSLELVVVVDASSDDDMWFAYDANNYKSRVAVSASADVSTSENAAADTLVYWAVNVRARLLFA